MERQLQAGGSDASGLVIGQPGRQASSYRREMGGTVSPTIGAAQSPAGALIHFEPLENFDGTAAPRGVSARKRREGLSSASKRERPGIIKAHPALQGATELQQQATPPGIATRYAPHRELTPR